ncbi:MAG: hypothetical protein ACP5E2_00480 [Terracidiphilus sp.]
MIRQAISCDICGAEKRQTNHWFVAYEQDGELRVSGWTSRRRLRPGSKHLCGQTCLHKLVDEFIANSVVLRAQRATEKGENEAEPEMPARTATDTTLATAQTEIEIESSARLIVPSEPVPSRPTYRAQPEIVTMPQRPFAMDPSPTPAETSRYASRRWHAEAWERERERELRSIENHSNIAARHRTSA